MSVEYRNNPSGFELFGMEQYAGLVVRFLEHLHPGIIIQRFVSSAPAGMVIAPNWGVKNYVFVAKVEKLMAEQNTWQGRRM
jgi:radical SAM superfamily enzyme